jgi:hypothetical protein
MKELAPPKSEIPIVLPVQSIVVEYVEKYIIDEPMDSRVRGWSWVCCE